MARAKLTEPTRMTIILLQLHYYTTSVWWLLCQASWRLSVLFFWSLLTWPSSFVTRFLFLQRFAEMYRPFFIVCKKKKTASFLVLDFASSYFACHGCVMISVPFRGVRKGKFPILRVVTDYFFLLLYLGKKTTFYSQYWVSVDGKVIVFISSKYHWHCIGFICRMKGLV